MRYLLKAFFILTALSLSVSFAYASDVPTKKLNRWADAEENHHGKEILEDRGVNAQRARLTKEIAEYVFQYAEKFEVDKLYELCKEICNVESDIPYLRDRKLLAFAKEYISWHDGFKVKVTASVEPVKEDPKCKKVWVNFSKLKRTDQGDSDWKSGIKVVATEVINPKQTVELLVGCESEYFGWNPKGSKRYYFTPAKDKKGEHYDGKFGLKGCNVKYTFDVSSYMPSGLPPRLMDLLNRYGKKPENLCEVDE